MEAAHETMEVVVDGFLLCFIQERPFEWNIEIFNRIFPRSQRLCTVR